MNIYYNMQTISELLASKSLQSPVKPRDEVIRKSLPRSEREMLLAELLPVLNSARLRDNFKPLTPIALSVVLKYYRTTELYGLQKECGKAQSFSKMFWFKVKQKKHDAQQRKNGTSN